MSLTLKSYPKDWDNDVRMNSLYAPFRNKELNPIDYESKMMFWKNLITSCMTESGCCTFSVEELEKTFIRNGRKPMCIKEVIDRMLSEREINYLSDFEALVPSNDTWTSWAVKTLVSTPIMWSFSKLKESIVSPPPITYEKKFISLPVTKRKAEELLSNINDDLKGIMLTFEQVVNVSKGCSIRESDLHIILHWLELEGLAVITMVENRKLVKFAQTGKKVEQVSEADKAIFSLMENEKQLTSSVENLEKQKQEAVLEAKSYLNKGMRQMAKSCLRKKKELEKQIDKHVAAIDNIHLLLTRIHDTEHNSKVFESYKISLSALKDQFKEAGLTEDNVSHTMAQVQEVLDIQDDIQSMLGEPASTNFTSDEDYETELEELLKNKPESRSKQPSEFDLNELDLPEPPSESPTSTKSNPKMIKKPQQELV